MKWLLLPNIIHELVSYANSLLVVHGALSLSFFELAVRERDSIMRFHFSLKAQ